MAEMKCQHTLEPGTPISGITHMALGLGGGSERRKYLQLENDIRRERVKSLPTQQDTNGVTPILQELFPVIAVPGHIREVGTAISHDAVPNDNHAGVLCSDEQLDYDN